MVSKLNNSERNEKVFQYKGFFSFIIKGSTVICVKTFFIGHKSITSFIRRILPKILSPERAKYVNIPRKRDESEQRVIQALKGRNINRIHI